MGEIAGHAEVIAGKGGHDAGHEGAEQRNTPAVGQREGGTDDAMNHGVDRAICASGLGPVGQVGRSRRLAAVAVVAAHASLPFSGGRR